jgi:hypothetical protein
MKRETATTKEATMKRRIKQNIWGNWYGYEGQRRVKAFCDSVEWTAEQNAERWLRGTYFSATLKRMVTVPE